MAYYSESGYCAEEMNRPAAYYGEGDERYAMRKEYEEIDEVERARRGHYGHDHLGHGGGSRHHHQDGYGGQEGCHEHYGGHREHAHGHGHGHGHGYGYGGRPYDACESKYYA